MENAFNLAHEIEHLENVQHYHDDEGTVHYDDSGKSDQHHAEHAGCGHALALPSSFAPQIALIAHALLRSEFQQYIPDHIPDRPQRPPQALR